MILLMIDKQIEHAIDYFSIFASPLLSSRRLFLAHKSPVMRFVLRFYNSRNP